MELDRCKGDFMAKGQNQRYSGKPCKDHPPAPGPDHGEHAMPAILLVRGADHKNVQEPSENFLMSKNQSYPDGIL
jgi:hypothetical protein